ncbi:hypothetical protein HK101_003063 [Irineochytrium annulatum]|nr:hypothetical protein HK101_003063 [Irineochytrium annulatum]
MNTILNKLQDLQCVDNCDDSDPTKHHFYEQPVWQVREKHLLHTGRGCDDIERQLGFFPQTLQMFVGETFCLLLFYFQIVTAKAPDAVTAPADEVEVPSAIAVPAAAVVVTLPVAENTPLIPAPAGSEEGKRKKLEGWATFLLAIPTLCDMAATTLMNVGLLYISASVYQMLRGSVVLFTGALSTIFLKRRHPMYRWFALLTVFIGVLLVGASSILQGGGSATYPVKSSPTGVILVVLAQAITASQFVIEESLMSKYDVPALQAVGLEGVFGILSSAVILPITYYFFGRTGEHGNFFDLPTGFHQTFGVPIILYAGVGICFSIAFFNWSGLSVTRRVSATARSTIDTCRTAIIWAMSLTLGWETFKWLQVLGFVVLIYGKPPHTTLEPEPADPYETETDCELADLDLDAGDVTDDDDSPYQNAPPADPGRLYNKGWAGGLYASWPGTGKRRRGAGAHCSAEDDDDTSDGESYWGLAESVGDDENATFEDVEEDDEAGETYDEDGYSGQSRKKHLALPLPVDPTKFTRIEEIHEYLRRLSPCIRPPEPRPMVSTDRKFPRLKSKGGGSSRSSGPFDPDFGEPPIKRSRVMKPEYEQAMRDWANEKEDGEDANAPRRVRRKRFGCEDDFKDGDRVNGPPSRRRAKCEGCQGWFSRSDAVKRHQDKGQCLGYQQLLALRAEEGRRLAEARANANATG